jgi:hypothetical protein
MATFSFDDNATPQDNIKLFYDHLMSVDPELTEILQTGLLEILPLPEPGPERNAKRARANKSILDQVDPSSHPE